MRGVQLAPIGIPTLWRITFLLKFYWVGNK